MRQTAYKIKRKRGKIYPISPHLSIGGFGGFLKKSFYFHHHHFPFVIVSRKLFSLFLHLDSETVRFSYIARLNYTLSTINYT